MLTLASRRCEALSQTRIEAGDSIDFGGHDARFDLVVSTQVLEYVADTERALTEIARVGGSCYSRPIGARWPGILVTTIGWTACCWPGKSISLIPPLRVRSGDSSRTPGYA